MTSQSLDPLAISTTGTALIEASAGTGKTYTITTLYVRLLLEGQTRTQPLTVQSILVVTFTDAATAELRLRIRGRLRLLERALASGAPTGEPDMDELLERREAEKAADRRTVTLALQDFDEAAIFTIHGFCQRVLRENAFESGVPFDVALVTTQTAMVGEIVRDFWVREMAPAPEVFVRFVEEEGIGVGALEALARRVLAHRGITVVPSAAGTDAAALQAAISGWLRARDVVARLWNSEGAAIIERLCGDAGLNRTSYRVTSIRGTWAPGIDALLANERAAWTKEKWFVHLTTAGIAEKTKKGHAPLVLPFFAACTELEAAERTLREAMAARLLQFRLDFVQFVRCELRRRKAAANVHYFDDLVHGLQEALERKPSGDLLAEVIRRRFPAALIDEFQDTDPAQYAIFEAVYGGRDETRLLVGDPKQAIYTFRGADVYAYLVARGRMRCAPHRLAKNYRSAPELITAVNAVFERHPKPFGPDIPFEAAAAKREHGGLQPAGAVPAPLRLLFVERPPADAEATGRQPDVINKGHCQRLVTRPVAAEIAALLSRGATFAEREGTGGRRDLGPGDIAVLCRTNWQAVEMQAALRELRVPSVVQSAGSVFRAPEATEVQWVVKALANPGVSAIVRAALATELLGLTAADLLRFDSDPDAWDEWLVRWRAWHELWLREGFLPAFRRVLDDTGAHARLLSLPDGERRLTNVLHLGELLHRAEAEGQGGLDGLDEWLRRMRQDPEAGADLAADAAQLRLESDAEAVKLVTVHKSKGLEYPVVFCPYLWDGKHWRDEDAQAPRFHDDAGRLTVDLGSADRAANVKRAQAESLAESVRLLYVALTRAREHCAVVWGAFRDAATSPLARVFHNQPGDDPVKGTLGSDAELQADLKELAREADGTISVETLMPRDPAPYAATPAAAAQLACRTMGRAVRVTRRVSSFSGLVAAPRTDAGEVGRDHDATDEAGATPGMAPVRDDRTIPLATFPRGTRAGQMVHRIFEQLDFPTADAATIAAVARRELAAEGIEADWQQPVTAMVEGVLDAPLLIPPDAGGGEIVLRSVPAERCRKEMPFVFPVAGDAGLTPERLAAVFERHAAPGPDPAAAATLRGLGFADLHGFLMGFIDLVFEQDGRWFVVDWKSNWLGPHPDDYRPDRLREPMRRHHYYLQYHLYVVALHKYLRLRLPAYDYDRHCGGVAYLFLRGMGPAAPAGNGVYWDRPSAALVEDLSAVLAATPRGRRP